MEFKAQVAKGQGKSLSGLSKLSFVGSGLNGAGSFLTGKCKECTESELSDFIGKINIGKTCSCHCWGGAKQVFDTEF